MGRVARRSCPPSLEGERTTSHIEGLDEKERLEEIARRVGGLKSTAHHRKAAAEMLEVARAVR